MPTYNPERDYPPHEQDNPFYVQQHGYLQRPHPNTVAGIAAAVDRVSKLQLPVAKRRSLTKAPSTPSAKKPRRRSTS